MYKEFTIQKKSGTYSEALQAYGLANLLEKIYLQLNIDASIKIFDENSVYKIIGSEDLSVEQIDSLQYFHLFNYIARKKNELPDGIFYNDNNVFRYEEQKELRKKRQKEVNDVYTKFKGKENNNIRNKKLKEITEKYDNEGSNKTDIEFDVYTQASTTNQFKVFTKLFNNFFYNKNVFSILIHHLLNNTLTEIPPIPNFEINPTSTQLYNPNKGKGLNKGKATGLKGKNLKSNWKEETLKISGSLNSMICQSVKVGSNYDLKIAVPIFNNINSDYKNRIVNDFKKHIKGNTPIKIDILNNLILSQELLKHSELNKDFFGQANNKIRGLFTAYQKDLGQNKAVVNISFINTPNFIKVYSINDIKEWQEIIDSIINLISNIDELGNSVQALLAFRNFLNSSNLESFFKFSNWYSVYLMQSLANKNFRIKPFTYNILNKFYKNMDNNNLNLMEIIEDDGFLAVAKAIRNSTVRLQFAKSGDSKPKFDIRYGVAQNLQNKSKSKKDFVEFIGNFISVYNSETAHYKENHPDFKDRAIVKIEELNQFYTLIEKYPKSSKTIGALLGSYGFATNKKDNNYNENN